MSRKSSSRKQRLLGNNILVPMTTDGAVWGNIHAILMTCRFALSKTMAEEVTMLKHGVRIFGNIHFS